MAGNVQLIDPLNIVSKLPENLNGTPDYEKMFIFAELTAERRGRSVLTFESTTGSVSLKEPLGDVNISMMGGNTTNPDNVNFTTKWTDNISTDTKLLEGFGITNINIKLTSSFVPTVTIEFVDIKGMTFYNSRENSPYKVLIDFPPPIFNLTLKGFYGRALTYQLHLVKTNSKFDSNNGNYHTTSEFVARTFSPLTDVPFKYIDVFPNIYDQTQSSIDPKAQPTTNAKNVNVNPQSFNVNASVKPRNTSELIKKLESLYDDISDIKNTSEESKILESLQTDKTRGTSFQNSLSQFRIEIETKNYRNNSAIIIKERIADDSNSGGAMKIINRVTQYNNVIISEKSEESTDLTNNSRLLLVIKNGIVRDGVTINPDQNTVTNNTNAIKEELNGLRETLLRKSSDIFTVDGTFVGSAAIIKDYEFIDKKESSESTQDHVEYIGIDITKLYVRLYQFIGLKDKKIIDTNILLTGLANKAAIQTLGMKPTIYNIFKILCDDVDTFYNILRFTNIEAEKHHAKYKDQIVSNKSVIGSKDSIKINAFPLYISANTVNKHTREVRSVPTEISNTIANSGGEQFPEIRLIDDFINVFVETQKKKLNSELKSQEDAQGNVVWIPSTPVDTTLINKDAESPYLKLEYQYQEVGDDSIIDKIYNKVFERFYVASQYSYGKSFYDVTNTNNVALIKLLAGSEASNLAASLINTNVINNLIDKSIKYKTVAGVTNFFNETNSSYRYNNIESKYLTIGNNFTSNQETINNGETSDGVDDNQLGTLALIKNRFNDNFFGLKILGEIPELRNNNEDGGVATLNPVDKYLNRDRGYVVGIQEFFNILDKDTILSLTKENVPYFADIEQTDDFFSKFLKPITKVVYKRLFNSTGSFVINWSYYLEEYDEKILDFFTGNKYTYDVKGFAVAANFFRTRSFFNANKIGTQISIRDSFNQPCVVEIPFYSIVYMGGLVRYNTDTAFKNQVDLLLNESFIKNNLGNLIPSTVNVDDATKADKLSNSDKATMLGYFNKFVDEFNSNDYGFVKIFNSIKRLLENGITQEDKQEFYEENLKSEYLTTITRRLNKKYAMAIFSEYTFSIDDNDISDYLPLSTTNSDITKSTSNEIYFAEFFNVLSQSLEKREKEITAIESVLTTSIGDNDIKTQLYYSFKSISDKWIAGLQGDNKRGFPLNDGNNDSLISKFVFVDRAMNPINDCILNVESLLEASNDYDVSVFTVMSKLLSLNGFEFFPLQNFMVHSNNQWEDAFKLFETVNQPAKPAFICMYIGGTSTTLNNPNNDYDDDGILDFEVNPPTDFTAAKTGQTGDFKYSQVKAFKVGYGEQNQSFFTEINLDTVEHTETNESLAILSRIANDESKSVPVPKGQNLFNVYENRSYSTTVSMLGNMMIQPTQYFQLENIPMFSGAYLILDVEHAVIPNHMKTTFHGVRIARYPNAIVTDFATSIGLQAGTTQDLSGNIDEDALLNDPIFEEARKNGIVSALLSGITPTTWSISNDAKISTLHPLIREDVANLINVLDQNGYRMTINSAFRSYAKQASLRADYESRLAVNPTNPGLPASKAGHSFHNFGFAFDIGLIDNNGDYIVSTINPYWDEIAEIAEKQGFRWGGRFINEDKVHFEKTLGYGYGDSDSGIIYNGDTVQYDIRGTLDTLRKNYSNENKVGEYVYV